jgi:flagellar motor protein MotB
MTRKLILSSIILMTITIVVLVNAVAVYAGGSIMAEGGSMLSLPESDIKGSQDHPILKRYAGSYILVDQRKKYEEFTLPLSPLEKESGKLYSGFANYSLNDKKTVEGPYTRLVYLMPAEPTSLEVIRNYQDEILSQGGSILYECKRKECGGSHQLGSRNRGDKGTPASLAMALRPHTRLDLKDWSRGFCALSGDIQDQRYLAAELPDLGTYISVHTYISKGDSFYNNCDKFKGRVIAVVDIIEGKPLENNMVIVKAEEMAKEISVKGRVSLYGIFFETNKFSVKEESEAVLQEIAKLVKQQPDIKFLVVGHTDNEGSFEYNKELSEYRALAVVRLLQRKYGVLPGRLTPVGASFSSPVSSNVTKKGRALNRRVELVENLSK